MGMQKGIAVPLRETQTNECPVSLITPDSAELVRLIFSGIRVHHMTGAIDFGTDSTEWDARFFDAMTVVSQEEQLVEMEMDRVRERGR